MVSPVSVALCTYNGERFIGEQVRSILDQTVPAFELVVSDDASSDRTLAIVAEVFAEARAAGVVVPELRVFRNEMPLGVVRNFEQAIRECRGDLIALSDQDDRWVPEKLERFVHAFAEHPDLLLINSDARLVGESGEPLGYSLFEALVLSQAERTRVRSGAGFAALLGRNIVTGATTVFRRALLEVALPFPGSWVHDEWLAVLASAFGDFDFLDEQLIDYRQHGANVIGAGRVTFAEKLARLREPRNERNRRLLERADALRDRLATAGADEGFVAAATAKVEHERVRSGLPAVRIARLGGVVREFGRGGYSRYGRGAQDALRDLVQPAR